MKRLIALLSFFAIGMCGYADDLADKDFEDSLARDFSLTLALMQHYIVMPQLSTLKTLITSVEKVDSAILAREYRPTTTIKINHAREKRISEKDSIVTVSVSRSYTRTCPDSLKKRYPSECEIQIINMTGFFNAMVVSERGEEGQFLFTITGDDLDKGSSSTVISSQVMTRDRAKFRACEAIAVTTDGISPALQENLDLIDKQEYFLP